MINNNSEQINKIKLLQLNILKYLSIVQYASWSVLKNNIKNLYATFSNDESMPDDNLEYNILYPLLRIGIIETARRPESDKLVYCLGPRLIIETEGKNLIEINPTENICREVDYEQIENYDKNIVVKQMDSLLLLKSIPTLRKIITHWDESEVEMRYIYDKFKKNHFESANGNTSHPNIYTRKTEIYSYKYIRIENETLYIIPDKEENMDADNIALSYLEVINNGKRHFLFSKNKNELTCNTFHTILPFIICRALILCDPMILTNRDGEIYSNTYKPVIKNVTIDHIKELKRIFGEKAVEVKND